MDRYEPPDEHNGWQALPNWSSLERRHGPDRHGVHIAPGKVGRESSRVPAPGALGLAIRRAVQHGGAWSGLDAGMAPPRFWWRGSGGRGPGDAPDPSAPRMIWVHWVVYNLPAGCKELPENVPAIELPPGTAQGKNDWHRLGYGGPCPPIGRHRYYFKLYALDTVLPELGSPSKAEVENAMQGHILDQAELMGTYQKQK